MTGMKRWYTFAVIAFALVGCTGSLKSGSPFAGRDLKGGEGVRMAILSFDNLSKSQGAGKSMENIMLTEVLKAAPITIVDPGEVAAALSEERVRLATSIPRENLLVLGKKLAVDYFMVGIVHEFEMQSMTGAGGAGQVPLISITLRVIDAKTGDIVWACNATRSGKDKETIFGIGKIDSLNALAELTAQDLAQAFARSFR